jgi:hypothetical protein
MSDKRFVLVVAERVATARFPAGSVLVDDHRPIGRNIEGKSIQRRCRPAREA